MDVSRASVVSRTAKRLRAAGAAAALAGGSAAMAVPSELVLTEEEGFTIPATVNGVTLRLRVDPGASGILLLNPAAARRAGVSAEELRPMIMYPGRTFRRAFARVGPVTLTGHAASESVVIGGQAIELKVGWFDADVVAGSDGLISVRHLPYDKVTFRLAAAGAEEAEIGVPLHYQLNLGLYAPYRVQGRSVPVQFSLWKEASVATAAAGAHLAAAHAGEWAGEAGRAPVAFGILRPVRPLALARPMRLSGLTVDRFLVRIRDHPGDVDLPPDRSDDPDEIIVTALKGKPQGERRSLTLGRDRFSACSEIGFAAAEQRLTLRCRTDAKQPASLPPRQAGTIAIIHRRRRRT